MSGFTISVGHQKDCSTFELHPKSRMFLEEIHPEAQPLASVFISYESEQDLAAVSESTWLHVAELLTSLDEAEISRLGGFEIVEPATRDRIYVYQKAAA